MIEKSHHKRQPFDIGIKACSILFLLLPPYTFATAELTQSHESIREAIKHYMEQSVKPTDSGRLNVQVGTLDARLRLTQCTKPLELFEPPGIPIRSISTLGVKCTDSKRWTIYVPVRIEIFNTVWIAQKPLTKGTLLTKDDITPADRDLSRLHYGYFLSKDEVLGKVLNRNIARGEVINPQTISIPNLIERGELVIITAKTGQVRVEMKGIAVTPGGKGQWIRVRNLSSQRDVDAMVSAKGHVEVTL